MVRFSATVDVRSLERVRLLALELERFEAELSEKAGPTHEFTSRLHSIRRRFLADLDGDKPED